MYVGFCPHCGEYEYLRNSWFDDWDGGAWVCELCEDKEFKRRIKIKKYMRSKPDLFTDPDKNKGARNHRFWDKKTYELINLIREDLHPENDPPESTSEWVKSWDRVSPYALGGLCEFLDITDVFTILEKEGYLDHYTPKYPIGG